MPHLVVMGGHTNEGQCQGHLSEVGQTEYYIIIGGVRGCQFKSPSSPVLISSYCDNLSTSVLTNSFELSNVMLHGGIYRMN